MKALLSILMLGPFFAAYAQKPAMQLTFTADINGQHIPLNSIVIENLTQGVDTTLNAPDSVLVLEYVNAIEENYYQDGNKMTISQNFPNPIEKETIVYLHLIEIGDVVITVTNLSGHKLINYEVNLQQGTHAFLFIPGSEKRYLFTAQVDGQSKTIKMMNSTNHSSLTKKCKLEYFGAEDNWPGYKFTKYLNGFKFDLGDELSYTAYTDIGERTITDSPTGSKSYTFQYSGGIPCPGITTVTYEGQEYNTVLIGNQCWLKENLNVGTMISSDVAMQDNGVIEKYCYNNDPSNCAANGGLYQWDEVMDYSNATGVQGICPPGWHIPTDEEWKQLEGKLDSYYGYPDPEWDSTAWRGFDAGYNLKAINGWNSGGNGIDLYGFKALPGGIFKSDGSFYYKGNNGYWWTSTEFTDLIRSWFRVIRFEKNDVYRFYILKEQGHSVRCLRDTE